jgi:hypothetical protein
VILIVLDAIKPITHKRLIEKELEGFGIRLVSMLILPVANDVSAVFDKYQLLRQLEHWPYCWDAFSLLHGHSICIKLFVSHLNDFLVVANVTFTQLH